jgi:hypothetical protein
MVVVKKRRIKRGSGKKQGKSAAQPWITLTYDAQF